jgi:hypothetical protein
LSLNTWTYLAATYDGSKLRMYVNGALVRTTNVSGNIVETTGVLRIGGDSMWGEYFQGRIDEVRIYNQTLTQSQIQTDMNTPVPSAATLTAAALASPTVNSTSLAPSISGTTVVSNSIIAPTTVTPPSDSPTVVPAAPTNTTATDQYFAQLGGGLTVPSAVDTTLSGLDTGLGIQLA